MSALRQQENLMDIKVLGTGCANCKNTIALIEQVAREKGVPVTLGKVEELREIMGYGVMSTPGVVIDGKVVHAGGVPSREKVDRWLSSTTTPCFATSRPWRTAPGFPFSSTTSCRGRTCRPSSSPGSSPRWRAWWA
jgi:small redox-active disulfide protein 2